MQIKYIDVPQRAFAVIKSTSLKKLRTSNLLFCTAFAGVNKSKDVAFLCHFDTPLSLLDTEHVLSQICNASSDGDEFEGHIIHGTPMLFPYSLLVALILYIHIIRKRELNIKVKYHGFLWFNLRRKISVSLNYKTKCWSSLHYCVEKNHTLIENKCWTMRNVT